MSQHTTTARREAAYAVAAALRTAEATKRATILELMGDRLADGPAPVPLYALMEDLANAGTPGFDGHPLRPRYKNRAVKEMVKRTDALLARMVQDGYLHRYRQRHAKGGIPLPHVWDLGPRVIDRGA